MGYDVLDVCRIIINYCKDIGKSVSNIKLQKILYYVQATFLVEKNKPCFKENIINWMYGPVVEEAYVEFRIYGGRDIPKQQEYIDVDYSSKDKKIYFNKQKFDDDSFCDEDKNIIKKVVDIYINESPFTLVKKTHKEAPWKSTVQNEVISNECIKTYYEDNLDLLYNKCNKREFILNNASLQ